MIKYSYEQRMEAVLNVVEKHMSYRSAGKLLGCDKSSVFRWVKRYELFGVEGLMLKHGKYTGELKQHVVEYMHENHLSISETAELFGIPTDGTIGKWKRIYYEEGPQALYRDNHGRKKHMAPNQTKDDKLDNKVELIKEAKEDLIAEIQRLRMENAYLKKLNALVQERIAREKGKK